MNSNIWQQHSLLNVIKIKYPQKCLGPPGKLRSPFDPLPLWNFFLDPHTIVRYLSISVYGRGRSVLKIQSVACLVSVLLEHPSTMWLANRDSQQQPTENNEAGVFKYSSPQLFQRLNRDNVKLWNATHVFGFGS